VCTVPTWSLPWASVSARSHPCFPRPPKQETTTAPTTAPATTAAPQPSEVPADPNGCGDTFYDPAHHIVDRDSVTAEIAALVRVGADVHVRVERAIDGTADDRMSQLQRTCTTWAPGGDRVAYLLVVMVLPDARQTGIYYGSRYTASLDGTWRSLQETAMNPYFRNGDFGGGIVQGLTALRRTLGDPSVPGAPAPNAPYVPVTFTDRLPTYSDREPAHSPSNAVPIIAFVLLMVAVIGINYIPYAMRDRSGPDADIGFLTWMNRRRGSTDHRETWRSSSGSSGMTSFGGGGGSSGSGSDGGSGGGGSTSW
jgi:uncharacterized membrane protein YgcG